MCLTLSMSTNIGLCMCSTFTFAKRSSLTFIHFFPLHCRRIINLEDNLSTITTTTTATTTTTRRSMDEASNNNHSSTNLNIADEPATCDKSTASSAAALPLSSPTYDDTADENHHEPSDGAASSPSSASRASPLLTDARHRMPASTTRAKEALRKHLMVKLTRYNDIEKELGSGSSSPSRSTTPSPPSPARSPPRRYPKRNRTAVNRNVYPSGAQTRSRRPVKNGDSTFDFDAYEWSTCLVAYEYDKAKNFFPMPGPSTVNYYENMELPGYYEPLNKPNQRKRKTTDTPLSTPKLSKPKRLTRRSNRKYTKTDPSTEDEEENESPEDNDIMMQSIYDSSFAFDSPGGMQGQMSPWNHHRNNDEPPATPQDILPPCIDVDDEHFASPALARMLQPLLGITTTDTTTNEQSPPKLIVPADNCVAEASIPAPSKKAAQAAIDNFEIAKCVNRTPFYGDPHDLNGQHASRMEVGAIVLQIPGNSVSDLPDFQSQLGIVGLYSWRRFALSNVTLNAQSSNEANALSDSAMREFLANESRLSIEPYHTPPALREAKLWLKARTKQTKLYSTTDESTVATVYQSDEDSPIKVRHEKPKTILIDGGDDENIIEIASSPESVTSQTSRARRQTRSQTKRSNSRPRSAVFPEAPAEVTCTPIRMQTDQKPRAKVSLNEIYNDIQVTNPSQSNAIDHELLNGKHSIYHDSDSRDSDVICLGDIDDAVEMIDLSVDGRLTAKDALSATSSDDTLVSNTRNISSSSS